MRGELDELTTQLNVAEALRQAGRLDAARAAFTAVADASLQADRPEVLAAAAVGLGGVWVHEHRTVIERTHVLELQRRALVGVDPASPVAFALRARVAAEEAYLSGDPTDVLAALADTRRAGWPTVLADTLSLVHHCLLGPDHGAVRLAVADELITVSSATHRNLDALLGLTWRTVDLLLMGDSRAERFLQELRSRLATTPCRCIEYVVAALDVMRATRAGRLTEAEAAADACYALGVEVGDADAFGWYGAQLVAIRWLQGRGAELLPALDELVASPTMAASNDAFLAGVAALQARVGHLDEARAALERIRARGLEATRNSSTWMVTMLSVIEAAHALADGDTARAAYDLLAPFADLPVMASLAVACFGSTHRPLALAALTYGELDLAITHLEAAVRADLRVGNRPYHAISCAQLADALDRRGEVGDTDRAAALRQKSRAAAERFGIELPRLHHHGSTIECRRVGRAWRLQAGTRVVRVPHSVGMTYLAQLLESPGTEFAAAELVGGRDTSASSRQGVLDDRAKATYRRRVEELRAEIDDADEACDLERAARARLELDQFLHELARATGLGGRDRSFVDAKERARTSVQKAIKRALDRIIQSDAAIGRALAQQVTTGVRCLYDPPGRAT